MVETTLITLTIALALFGWTMIARIGWRVVRWIF